MRKSYIFIAMAMVAALTTVSCKCSSNKPQEPTQEEVQAQKQALADSVLAKIDEIADQYRNARTEGILFSKLKLTEAEKLIKPDYLLDPSVANNLVTRSQKINALAIYGGDIAISKAYDMPYDDLKEAAIKLAVDLNLPFDIEYTTGNEPVSEKIKDRYSVCKERGDLALFWQFEYAAVAECIYILSQNPELFLSKITDEQWQAWSVVKQTRRAAIEELAKYDEEMAQVWGFIKQNIILTHTEESNCIDQSIETAKLYYIANKDKYAAWRNALLQ